MTLRAALRRWWVPAFRTAWREIWSECRLSFLRFIATPCWLSLKLAIEPWGGLLVIVTPAWLVRTVYVRVYVLATVWWPAYRAWLRTCPTLDDAMDARLALAREKADEPPPPRTLHWLPLTDVSPEALN